MLIGVDLETTGLDECQEDILEIALVAIETPSFKIVDSYSAIVIPSEFCWAHIKNPQTDNQRYVRDIHEKSGLFQRSEEHTSELQSQSNLVCRLLLEKKKKKKKLNKTTTI